MRFTFEEEEEEDLGAVAFLGSKGCGLYKPKRPVSLLSESLLSDSFLPSKQEEKEVKELWGNYRRCRYRILSQSKSGESILLHPNGSEFTVQTAELSDVGTHRESIHEKVCYICKLPWSVCVVGGRDKNGVPFGPNNPG